MLWLCSASPVVIGVGWGWGVSITSRQVGGCGMAACPPGVPPPFWLFQVVLLHASCFICVALIVVLLCCAAQERLTHTIARAHSRTSGEAQEWVRLMLSCVGRGGDGQRIRDEILHIMHR